MPRPCTVLDQDCAGPDTTCTPLQDDVASGLCLPAGLVSVRSACSNPDDGCSAGLLCLGEEPQSTSGFCAAVCNGDNCGAGQWCMPTRTANGMTQWGLCVAGEAGCDPVWQDCAGGLACMVPDTIGPLTCQTPGVLGLDRTCFLKDACAGGLQCVALVGFNVDVPNYTLNAGYLDRGGSCRRLCHLGHNQRCRTQEICAPILNTGIYREQVGVCADMRNP